MTSFEESLKRVPLIAILRGISPDEAAQIGAALIEESFEIIEVPLNSPAALTSIEKLACAFAQAAVVGAGTVLRPEDIDSVCDAGGGLVVMPHTDEAVIRRAKARKLTCIPGFATPTEAFRARDAGADALKLFPAEGSAPTVLKALRAVLPPDVPIMPVGGVDETQFESWIRAGAAGFGIGSALYRPGMKPAELRGRARKLVAALRALAGLRRDTSRVVV